MALFRQNGFRGRDIAIDLGTANTLVFVQGRGIVVSEPSVVAIDERTKEVHAVGDEAKRMIGRTPATISAQRPLRHGVITDYEITERMLRYFIGRVHGGRFSHPRVVMCVPSGVTDVEQRAVQEACLAAGAREVLLIEEPMAAAIGADLPVAEPTANMVVDVGGGTSEVAVISMGGFVVARSLRIGGYDLDDSVASFIRAEHKLAVGEQTAEDIKLALGSAAAPREAELEVRGRDLVSGLPKSIVLTGAEIRRALDEPLRAIVAAVKDTLDQTPPELASDIVNDGMLLAGGGCLLYGFAERLHQETGMATRLADSPLTTVAEGAGRALDEIDVIRRAHERRPGRPRAGGRS
ncbi:MAG: rod shape-determining protein MreB [Solirubrobacteraceae bacterium]|jgi:rod shape-determining protein MreB|nr:rod shape-determining protein MreB [Solirubrobacteraceae bacterium]